MTTEKVIYRQCCDDPLSPPPLIGGTSVRETRIHHDLGAGIAAGLGATPAQVALAWLLAHYEHTLLIPGTSDPAHLAANIAVGSLRLPAASVAALDQLAEPE